MTIVELSRDAYHADVTGEERPSLSATIARILCAKSPLHAWTAHPRLNPHYRPVEKEAYDIGTVAHDVLLEGRDVCHVVEAVDWRTNAAKLAREEARQLGKVPLLAHQYADVLDMVDAARKQLLEMQLRPLPFTDGEAEQTIVWDEGGVLCRARVDWLHADGRTCDDYKSSHDANPETWPRRALSANGYDVQMAFHSRGVRAVFGEVPVWRWIVQEKQPPYALIVVTPDAGIRTVAEAKVDYALRLWRECLAADRWPGYRPDVVCAELPAWADEAKWLSEDYVLEKDAA